MNTFFCLQRAILARFFFGLLGLLLAPHSQASDPAQVLIYDAIANANGVQLDGRVIERRELSTATPDDSHRKNLWRTLKLLRQDEFENTSLTLIFDGLTQTLQTDDEGRFRSFWPGSLAPGWHTVRAHHARGLGEGEVLQPHPANRLAIISDVDDTLQVSEVLSKRQLLRHSLEENFLQRQTFPGTPAFYQQLLQLNPYPEASLIAYLSASPRQLEPNIRQFLQHQGFPRGALFLKTFAWHGGDPWMDQQAYKQAVIERLFQEHPKLRFILLGDDGEKDPEIYAALQQRHPEQVAAILIRPIAQRAKLPGQCDLQRAIIDRASCPALQQLAAKPH